MLMMAVSSGFAVATENIVFLVALLALIFFTLAIGDADLGLCFKRCRALFAIIAALFVIQSVFAFRTDPNAVPLLVIANVPIVYAAGLYLAASLALRLLVIVTAAQILLEGEMRDYLLGLVQMRIPYEIAFMTQIALHFLPILREEAISISQCMQLRGVAFHKTGPIRRMKAFAGLCLPVFVGALRRADETSTAMELRAFRACPSRTYMRRLALKDPDVIVMAIWCVTVTSLYLICHIL
jgi:energy-coupling factor transport system permease protein